ncbi:MAG: hypothetical protein WD266_07930 [Balneolales bacterium]
MNIGIVASTLVGGMVLFAIVSLNIRVSQHAGENTLYHTAKINTDMLAEVITFDLNHAGYGYSGTDAPVITANDSTFAYNTSDQETDIEKVMSWYYDSGQLSRVDAGDDVVMSSNIIDFRFTYYDLSGIMMSTPVTGSDLEDIRQIKVSLISESVAKYGNKTKAPSSAWESTFTPRNLNN